MSPMLVSVLCRARSSTWDFPTRHISKVFVQVVHASALVKPLPAARHFPPSPPTRVLLLSQTPGDSSHQPPAQHSIENIWNCPSRYFRIRLTVGAVFLPSFFFDMELTYVCLRRTAFGVGQEISLPTHHQTFSSSTLANINSYRPLAITQSLLAPLFLSAS